MVQPLSWLIFLFSSSISPLPPLRIELFRWPQGLLVLAQLSHIELVRFPGLLYVSQLGYS